MCSPLGAVAHLEEQVTVDMSVLCPQEVNKMHLNRARMVYWKRRAAKHECEEFKEGGWLEPIQAMSRRKTNELWKQTHRNVMKKLVVEGGWVHKKIMRYWLVR